MSASPKLDRETTATAVRRLRRVEGQVKGVQRMLEEDRDCAEIIQQIAAARSALDRVALDLISTGLEQCLRLELRGKTRARSTLHKLQKTFMMLR
ncbi:MAG: metal-sensitive transcriptional regulator [Armatimonadota bacterium]|nr:metal-sensitive transcriptional regulator [Armatimonadota bacterium]MDR7426622.1 metal-sensitive transcriptional regulator [Armatimonadota bacterium]MDR7464060.1 metal-sensitive transcriptional regulator [Armatimonadota bacterium]MDR7468642.1 metal-sensitive transcriptional regulator [Armatimonadota bacterium]MDR7473765.1 metal-sensitive transcriptional regulator [Armatimonadota bacterium]